MMEWPDRHEGLSGGHVAYLDGHVEWIDYPGKFPMTADAVAAFNALTGWQHATAWAHKDYTLENDPNLQALCEHNMRYLGYALKTFDGIHKGWMPELSPTSGTLMFRTARMVPFHLNDLRRLNCPASEAACDEPVAGDRSYVYLGYVLKSDADAAALAEAYAAQIGAGGDFSGDLPHASSYGSSLLRLREGVQRVMGSEYFGDRLIPVMVEWPDNHGSLRGGNVLYMDGHVEWIDYPGKFPMSAATIGVLANLAGRGPIE
jgi:prepilin-type processing-associated H-X9-DG protein